MPIGTGSHDLSDAVGGVTTLMGMDVLEADPATDVIVLISKPAGTATLSLLQDRIRRCPKPVVGCLFGLKSRARLWAALLPGQDHRRGCCEQR